MGGGGAVLEMTDGGAAQPASSTTHLSLERIAEAARVIDPVFLNTPQFVSEPLSARVGARIVCKLEMLNPVRSFKGRGADYYLYTRRVPVGRLVCASAGNFGQGMAYAARRRGVPLVVFAACNANPLKIERMRSLGAEVRLVGEDFDAAKLEAARYALDLGAVFVEDGAEPAIAEGAGSMAVELTQGAESLDEIFVPVGNGALIGGVGCWLRANSPSTRVVGVCAAGAPSMYLSWATGTPSPTDTVATIADGIAVRVPVAEAVAQMAAVAADVVLVEDGLILEAMMMLFDTLGVVVEPAGAAALAGCLRERDRLARKTVAVLVGGGNLTPEQVRAWLIN